MDWVTNVDQLALLHRALGSKTCGVCRGILQYHAPAKVKGQDGVMFICPNHFGTEFWPIGDEQVRWLMKRPNYYDTKTPFDGNPIYAGRKEAEFNIREEPKIATTKNRIISLED